MAARGPIILNLLRGRGALRARGSRDRGARVPQGWHRLTRRRVRRANTAFFFVGVLAIRLLSPRCGRSEARNARGGGVMTIDKILVPLDGSDLAEAALETAIDLLNEHSTATLLLLRAAEAPRSPGSDRTEEQVRVVREAERYLSGVAAGLRESGIDRDQLARYLASVLGAGVEVLDLRPLKAKGDEADDPKGFGYGVPFEVECTVGGVSRSLVVSRTRPVQGFGHDYPADRAWQALYGHAAYNSFPRHARSLDVGIVRDSGELVSVSDAAEFFQLVEKVDGILYWQDLERLLEAPLRELDVARAEALGRFLAEVHAVRRDEPTLYQRRIRELVGHGECLMGVLDSYPHPYPWLRPEVCEDIERTAVSWRWRLRNRAHRLSRTHGDFHPWNLLFREGADFSVLARC